MSHLCKKLLIYLSNYPTLVKQSEWFPNVDHTTSCDYGSRRRIKYRAWSFFSRVSACAVFYFIIVSKVLCWKLLIHSGT